MSARTTWIKGKMHFPPDIDPADIDWVKPLVAYPKPVTERAGGHTSADTEKDRK